MKPKEALIYLVGAKRVQEKNRDTEYLLSQEQLEMFEALVRVDEREACAELCHWVVAKPGADVGTALMCVEKIRARGNT